MFYAGIKLICCKLLAVCRGAWVGGQDCELQNLGALQCLCCVHKDSFFFFSHLLEDGCSSQSADRLLLKKIVRSIFIRQSWRTLITGTTVCML